MKINLKIKNQNTLLLIIAAITTIGAIACGVWYFIPHPPHADIVTLEDAKDFKKAEDWYKVTRWEVVSVDMSAYDKSKDEYGFFGKVTLKGAGDPVYAALTKKDGGEDYSIEEGDVVYAKTSNLEKNFLFGNMVTGDILYIEKGGAKK